MSRTLLITAHPDDETISGSAILSQASYVRIFQLTDGVHSDAPDFEMQIERRRLEREAAFAAAGWPWHVYDPPIAGREAMYHLAALLGTVRRELEDTDVVYTHPYEAGHLDHDTAAWLVQTACASLPNPPNRMEFASYHATASGQAFGTFWRDGEELEVALADDLLARKQAALACFESQAHIIRKFKSLDREVYRVAPVYDFSKPAPPPRARWDVKRYKPTTAEWRAEVAKFAQVAA